MPRPDRKPGGWGLRTRLVAPMILLVLFGASGIGIMGSILVRQQAETLVGRRGDAVLVGIAEQVSDRQRSKEIFAQLLAEEDGVADAVQQSDKIGLAQVMVPRWAKLGLGQIVVRTGDGQELLHVGARNPGITLGPLSDSALAGLTRSTVGVGDNGMEVWASTPIKGHNGIVGALMVGTTLDEDALKALGAQDGIDLAVFRNGRLIASSSDQPELVSALAGMNLTAGGLETLERDLDRFDVHPAARPIGDDGLLVALIPTQGLALASRNLTLGMFGGTFALMVAVLLAGLAIARDIAAPLDAMVSAAQAMVRGHYRDRVPQSNIRELNGLANSFNNLAEQLEIQVAELAHQAFHDSLSKLPNRVLFVDRVEQALRRADRREHHVALLFLDLDNFKVVNDSLGHHTGDQLLVAVAERLRLCLRTEDTAARLGGDEFTVLLESVGGVSEAIRVAERIQEQLQEPFDLGGHEVFTSVSIGIALNTRDQDRPDELLRDADLAMYRAKANGKARYEVFDPKLNALAMERLRLETDLRRAVEREEFRVYYQPVVLLETGEVAEVEALVRWEHAQRGLLLPAEFIPLAEETGLIIPVGRWVLEEACRQTRLWQMQRPVAPPLRVCVNLSTRQFQNPKLVDEVGRVLGETELPPSALKLEITESVMIHDVESTLETLRQLKNLGIQLAVDDFGTGYSSLAYLKQFPVDALKIDRAFVETLGQGSQDVPIVRAVIAFAKALNLTVTGEGVETAEQLTMLRMLGCDHGQGHYFSRPLPKEAASILLASTPRW